MVTNLYIISKHITWRLPGDTIFISTCVPGNWLYANPASTIINHHQPSLIITNHPWFFNWGYQLTLSAATGLYVQPVAWTLCSSWRARERSPVGMEVSNFLGFHSARKNVSPVPQGLEDFPQFPKRALDCSTDHGLWPSLWLISYSRHPWNRATITNHQGILNATLGWIVDSLNGG